MKRQVRTRFLDRNYKIRTYLWAEACGSRKTVKAAVCARVSPFGAPWDGSRQCAHGLSCLNLFFRSTFSRATFPAPTETISGCRFWNQEPAVRHRDGPPTPLFGQHMTLPGCSRRFNTLSPVGAPGIPALREGGAVRTLSCTGTSAQRLCSYGHRTFPGRS